MVIVKTYVELVAERQGLRLKHKETEKQMAGNQPYIKEVFEAIQAQLLLEIRAIQLKIEARDSMLGGRHIFGKAVQLPFDFLFECSIRDDEIPF